MFCIVRCNRCGALQGAVLPLSRSRCRTCGYSIDISKNTPLGTFEKEKDMRETLQNIRSRGVDGIFEQGSSSGTRPVRQKPPITLRNREERTKSVLEIIGNDVIGYEELKTLCLLKGFDEDDFEHMIRSLLDQNLVFEPRHGLIARVIEK